MPRTRTEKPKTELDLKSSIRLAFSQTPRVFSLVFGADKTSSLIFMVASFVGALLPLAVAWLGKLIIDAVVLAGRTGVQEDRSHAIELVFAELGVMLALGVVGLITGVVRTNLGTKLAYFIHSRILDKALSLELSHFEDPSVYDKLQNARREASSRPLNLFTNIVAIAGGIVTLASYGALLVAFNPWTLLALLVATVPAFLVEAKYSGEAFRVYSWRAPEQRKMRYLESLLTSDSTVKEVKLYGFGQELLSRYNTLYQKLFAEERSLAVRRSLAGFLLSTVSSVVLYGCYAYFAARAIDGALTIGDMTLYITVFRNGQGALRSILRSVGSTYEDNLFMSNLFGFLELKNAAPAPLAAVDLSKRTGFVLDHVTFRYPAAKKPAVDDLSMTIGPGEKLAIVGENGAGKSTLIKLLTGLYRPTGGTITLDGVPLDQIPRDVLHARFAVVLQDFVRYQFTARDNVVLGDLEHAGEADRLERAAKQGGADEVVAGLPNRWDTQLGRQFDGGTELSIGSWQKMAISRAFMRDADILVLDEPTASLDAEAEHALFLRFKALAANKTAILISHRFSTVRMADRIVVLNGGKLEEVGSHAELIEKNGRYAHLFNLQAAGYLDG
jgi:ABC-type multidrug transport system fused ATPase/permease subunit